MTLVHPAPHPAPHPARHPARHPEARQPVVDAPTAARPHNERMEAHFEAIRAGNGARAALENPPVTRAAVPVFACAVRVAGTAPVVNPSQPSTTANFYEIEPVLADGAPLEPGTPLGPGLWTVRWTCPLYPANRGGPAAGEFHIAVDVPRELVPLPWAANGAGPIAAPPANVELASASPTRVARTLRTLVAAGERAEARACEDARGFVAHKTTGLITRHRWVFDEDDAMQEGMRILLRQIRMFSARGRPKACWTTAAGLVLERDLPRAADKVSGLPAAVARCADWLRLTDLVDLHDPALTPEHAALTYEAEQRSRRRRAPRARSWLADKEPGQISAAAVATWRRALDVARAGDPLRLDGDTTSTTSGSLVDRLPLVDAALERVGEPTLDEAVEDLLVGTDLGCEEILPYLRVELARRDRGATSRGRGRRPVGVESRLLSLVVRPGEDLRADREVLRARVEAIFFDERGSYRSSDERARRWLLARRAATAGPHGEGSPRPGGASQSATVDGSTTS